MYEVFLLHANWTVSLQLVMNVLRWIVLSHCIYRVCYCCLSILTSLGCDGVLEKSLGSPGNILEESGNPGGTDLCVDLPRHKALSSCILLPLSDGL